MFDIAAIDAKAGAPTRKELAYELCSVLNAELCLNGIPIPQITGGRLALLDAIESPIISDKKYSKRDVDIAMFIMMMGKDSVNSIAANIYDNASFEKDLKKLRILLGDYPSDAAVAYIRQSLEMATEGFSMIPGKESGGEPATLTFGAEWVASYVSQICPAVGMDIQKILWEFPLVSGGFIIASLARQNGVKNVQRKLDDKAMLDEIARQIEAQKKDQKNE